MNLPVLNETVKSAREAALIGDYRTSIADYETVLHLLRQQQAMAPDFARRQWEQVIFKVQLHNNCSTNSARLLSLPVR